MVEWPIEETVVYLSAGACADPKIGHFGPDFEGTSDTLKKTDGIWGGAPESSEILQWPKKVAIRGSKGHFYCILLHSQVFLLYIFPKIGGGTSKRGGGARPKVAHRERTRLFISSDNW